MVIVKKRYGLLSLICGILSLPLCIFVVPGVLALTLAILCQRREVVAAGNKEASMARWGAILGSVSLGFAVLVMICAALPDSRVTGQFALLAFLFVAAGCFVACLVLSEKTEKNKKSRMQKTPISSVPDCNHCTLTGNDCTRCPYKE